MDADRYYVVTEDDDIAIEEIPAVEGKATILCTQPDLAVVDEKLELRTYSDLAVARQARPDIEWIRIRDPQDPKLIEKPDFLEEALS